MEIQELILKKYGKFSDHHITFRPGINIIYGGNETGKTTIHSFIKAMLFGLNRARGRAAKMDEYQIRQPWDSPGAFLGSMRVVENGEVYRIDRCFDRSAKPLSLVCETRILESEHPQEDLDILLGGISEAAFVNSVFISQARCETDEALAEELRRRMVNSDHSMDGGIDVSRALQILRKKKRQCEQQKKKEEAALEEKISQKQGRADALRTEMEQLRAQAACYQKGNADQAEEFAASEKEEAGISPVMRAALTAMLFIAGALTMTGIFFASQEALRIFLGVFTVIFWVMALGVHALFRPHGKEKMPADDAGENLVKCPPGLIKELQKREEEYKNLQDDLEVLYQQHVRAGGADTEIAALTLAIDRICEISDGIFRTNGGRINEIASGILEEITMGRYNRIVLDDTAEVRIHTPERVLGLNQVSGGTLQQIYFALRMAAGEVFMDKTTLPVILDETFAMYDDRRLEATLRWLKNSGRQVILFTCQNREREILKKL
ncbi:MAG: AAA family ATPase [Clostridiales bacterium]|nr:AAA family ATPase [Clostridiales bacterium]MCC8065661.1 AAA family ATPase [Clostridiales bacterium]